jgi:hypothetical protein
MSIRAGDILHVGGQNVIDRLQQAGLGNVNLPIETIREIGNREVVDKIPQEPSFTFALKSFNVSCELMAFLTGHSAGSQASAADPAQTLPDGTEFNWLDCGFVNIASPWKNPATGSAGVVEAGHLVPGFYPTKLSYSFGVTADADQSAELSGGSFFYSENAPVEDQFAGTGAQKAFVTNEVTVHYRRGGAGGSTFRDVFGVLVDGQLQTEDIDYVVSGGNGSKATITFTNAPANNADIRCCYFTSAAKSYPQSVHASTQVVPGAVRGRNIRIEIDANRIGGVQTFTMDATVAGEVERELGTEDVVGYVVNGTDCNGTATIRAKDKDAFFDVLSKVTGVDRKEVFGWFNDNTVAMDVKIENPKDPGTFLKTIRIVDAKFQPPGTPGVVNAATDFQFQWSSVNGTFSEFKGEPPA